MEAKKTKRANLEKDRSVYTLLGLVIALSLVWSAFEHKTYDISAIEYGIDNTVYIDDAVSIRTKTIKPPPPPPKPMQTSIIEIVSNDEPDIDIDIDIETDEKEYIEEAILTQKEEIPDIEDEIFVYLQDNPEYPGGDKARLEFLSRAIIYPQLANEMGIQGTVYTTFVIEKDGSITNVEILRGIGGGCDESAINAIKAMPNWKPGKQRGRAVRAQFNMPIQFILK